MSNRLFRQRVVAPDSSGSRHLELDAPLPMQRMLHSSLRSWAHRNVHHAAAKCAHALTFSVCKSTSALSDGSTLPKVARKGRPLFECLEGKMLLPGIAEGECTSCRMPLQVFQQELDASLV